MYDCNFVNLLLIFIHFYLIKPQPPRSTLFPYTTLFRSSSRTSHVRRGRQEHGLQLERGQAWVLAEDERADPRSEEHTSELQSPDHLVCRLLLEKKKKTCTLTSIDYINKYYISDYLYHRT